MGLFRRERAEAAGAGVAVAASAPQVRPSWGANAGFVPAASLLTGDLWGSGLTISRDAAMSIPAMRQGVTLISGTCGTFPFRVNKGRNIEVPMPHFLQQPDPDEPASITWTRIYQDLVLYPYAWMYVTDYLSTGFPRQGIHVPAEQVTIADGRVWWNGQDVTARMIRFDSPAAPGALYDGARILTTAMMIEEAVRRFSAIDIPSGALKQTGGPELLDTEIDALLTDWEAARRSRTTAYLSQTIDYQQTTFDPRALQLVEARAANAVDIARLLNLPPVYVNAETGGSLTYSTTAQQAQALSNTTLVPYLNAMSGRLSMDDVMPHGQYIRHTYDAFIRTDLKGRADAYAILLSSGLMTVDEIRALESLPPISEQGDSAADVAPRPGEQNPS